MSFGFAHCLAAADRLRRGPEASGPWGSRVPGGNYSKLLAVSRTEHSIAVPAPRVRTTFQAAGLFGGARIGIDATAMA